MKTTISDLASITGLSVGTISNYLNGRKIKEKNREIIEKAIKEKGYKIDYTGRTLRTKKTGLIGIMVPSLDDPFAPMVISSLEIYLRKNGYAVIICDTLGDIEIEKSVVDFFIERNVEGVVFFPVENNAKRYNIFEENNIHSVCIDNKIDNFKGDFVGTNNSLMIKQATDYLIEKGHKKIGIMCGPDNMYTASERLKGYLESLKEHNIKIKQEYIKKGMYTEDKIASALIESLLKLEEPPTAIIASNYFFNIGAMNTFNKLKLKIGSDISLFGFDNSLSLQVLIPKITLIEQNTDEIAAFAAAFIMDRIQSKSHDKKPIVKLVEGKIVEGDSVVKLS